MFWSFQCGQNELQAGLGQRGNVNVNTELLDSLLGPRLDQAPDSRSFSAIISSAKADEKHPRKAVVRAMIHRGGNVATTEGKGICSHSSNAPEREGWSAVSPEPYPEEQED